MRRQRHNDESPLTTNTLNSVLLVRNFNAELDYSLSVYVKDCSLGTVCWAISIFSQNEFLLAPSLIVLFMGVRPILAIGLLICFFFKIILVVVTHRTQIHECVPSSANISLSKNVFYICVV